MKLFARLMLCWVVALSSGGAFAVSSPLISDVSTEVAAR
jgi:hypothetical protein